MDGTTAAPGPTDKELVLRAREMDGLGAFRDLHERHAAPVLAFLARLLEDDPLAISALHDTFLRAHGSLDRYDEERSFRAWLFGTARDTALDALRVRSKMDPSRPGEAPVALAPELRALVVQRHGLDMQIPELAESLSVTEKTATARLRAALVGFAERLASTGDASEACLALRPALAVSRSGLLDTAEESVLEAHLSGCTSCLALGRALEQALAKTMPEARSVPADAWDRLSQAIEAESDGRPALSLRVALACTFCHARLQREEATFCAGCLAPHHADCFETHGRCSAHGCGETRTVGAGQRTRRSPGVLVLVGALGLVVGVALVVGLEWRTPIYREQLPAGNSSILGERATETAAAPAALGSPETARPVEPPELSLDEALALLAEPESPAPPYPWPELEDFRVDPKLNAIIDIDRDGTLEEIARSLESAAGRSITVEPEFAGKWLAIHLTEVNLRNVLLITAELVPGAVLGVAPDGGLRFGRCSELACRGAILRDRASDQVPRVETSIRKHIFADAPLRETVAYIQSATGLNMILKAGGHGSGSFKSVCWLPTPVKTVLLDLESSLHLAVHFRHGVAFVEPIQKTPDAMPGHATLDLHAKTIPDLVAALREQGVPCFVAPDTWRSRGTFAISLVNAASLELTSELARATGLRVFETEQGVMIEGAMPSVRAARASTVPEEWQGVRTQLIERKKDLEDALCRRLPSVRQKTAELLAFVERAHALPTAEARRDTLRAESWAVRSRRDERLATLNEKVRQFGDLLEQGFFGGAAHKADHRRREQFETEFQFGWLEDGRRGDDLFNSRTARDLVEAENSCWRERPYILEIQRVESDIRYFQSQFDALDRRMTELFGEECLFRFVESGRKMVGEHDRWNDEDLQDLLPRRPGRALDRHR